MYTLILHSHIYRNICQLIFEEAHPIKLASVLQYLLIKCCFSSSYGFPEPLWSYNQWSSPTKLWTSEHIVFCRTWGRDFLQHPEIAPVNKGKNSCCSKKHLRMSTLIPPQSPKTHSIQASNEDQKTLQSFLGPWQECKFGKNWWVFSAVILSPMKNTKLEIPIKIVHPSHLWNQNKTSHTVNRNKT